MVVNGARVLEDGLLLVVLHLARQNCNILKTKRRWFRASFGVGPVALSKIFNKIFSSLAAVQTNSAIYGIF
jgi:hypothetical protein